MVNGRNKGHNFERELAEEFRQMGFVECVTARSESKRVDDSGVDLCFTGGLNIQAKFVETLGSPHNALKHMPDEGKINAVYHKRSRKGVIVAVSKDDFHKLLKLAGLIPSL